MKSKLLELDPNGDIELILLQPNTQALQWPADGLYAHNPAAAEVPKPLSKKEKKKKQRRAQNTTLFGEPPPAAESGPPAEPEPAAELHTCSEYKEVLPFWLESSDTHALKKLTPISRNGEINEVRMLVSSRHLCLASSTFRTMLQGPWHEGCSNDEPTRQITTTEWDAEALLIVLDMVHGHHRAVPRSISLEMLAKIATIVDYYNCHEVTEVFVDHWILGLENNLPFSYGIECVLWLSVSWVFSRADILKKMADIAVMECRLPIETMGLPFPDTLSSE